MPPSKFRKRMLLWLLTVACATTLLSYMQLVLDGGLVTTDTEMEMDSPNSTSPLDDDVMPETSMDVTAGVTAGTTSELVDEMTSAMMFHRTGLPNLLVLGAQKAGSTATSKYLFDYTAGRVCGAIKNRKEPHFYSTEKWNRGVAFYQSLYAHCRRSAMTNATHLVVVTDATPRNLVMAQRVHEVYRTARAVDQLKIMVTLREPVSRELSWYQHLYRLQEPHLQQQQQQQLNTSPNHTQIMPPLRGMLVNRTTNTIHSFDEWINHHILRQIEMGRNMGVYVRFLRQWFDLFPRENILVQSYDELTSDPGSFLQRMHSFLGLPIAGPLELPRANARHAETEQSTPCSAQQRLQTSYHEFNQQLYELLETNPGPPMEIRPFPEFQFHCK